MAYHSLAVKPWDTNSLRKDFRAWKKKKVGGGAGSDLGVSVARVLGLLEDYKIQIIFLPQASKAFKAWFQGFPDSSVGKKFACNAGDPGSIPGSGRSAGEGIGYPL